MRLTSFVCNHCHTKAPPAPGPQLSLLRPALHPDWMDLCVQQGEMMASEIHLCPICACEPLIIYQVIRRQLDKLLQERQALNRIEAGDVTSQA